VARVRALAAALAPQLPAQNFQVAELDDLPWQDQTMDAVICSAVLHFASDTSHFGREVQDGALRVRHVAFRPHGR